MQQQVSQVNMLINSQMEDVYNMRLDSQKQDDFVERKMIILKGQLKQVLKKINKEQHSPRPSSEGSSLDSSSSIFSSSLFEVMKQEEDAELQKSDLRQCHLNSNFSAIDSSFFKDHSDSLSDQ